MNLQASLFILQNKSNNTRDKLFALRYLNQYLQEDEQSMDNNVDENGNKQGIHHLDYYHKISIRQLVMDNVMILLMNDDNSVDVRKRQLVRTECFLILASLLKSNTLFKNLKNEDVNEYLITQTQQRVIENEYIDESESKFTQKSIPLQYFDDNSLSLKDYDDNNDYDRMDENYNNGTGHISLRSNSLTNSMMKLTISGSSTQSSQLNKLRKLNLMRKHSQSSTSLGMLKPLLITNMNKFKFPKQSKKLNPRPSVLNSDKLVKDSFVPGVDPNNYFEQDRKLGYQKVRMWFPSSGIQPIQRAEDSASLLPSDRKSIENKKNNPNQIVEEYLQMRALASFVGDLVQPFGKNVKKLKESNILKSKPLLMNPINSFPGNDQLDGSVNGSLSSSKVIPRLSGIIDPQRFNTALSEAVSIWTPLLGIHLPTWATKSSRNDSISTNFFLNRGNIQPVNHIQEYTKRKKRRTQAIDDNESETGSYSLTSASSYNDENSESMNSSIPSRKTKDPTQQSQKTKFSFNKGIAFDDIEDYSPNKEFRSPSKRFAAYDPMDGFSMKTDNTNRFSRSNTLKRPFSHSNLSINDTDEDADDYTAYTSTYQSNVYQQLTLKKLTIESDMHTIASQMQETIRQQYSLFPSKFILLIEGSKANGRKLLANALFIFTRVKRRNLLILAMGIWKICLVEKVSLQNRVKYSKTAAVYLLVSWIHYKKLRVIKQWVKNWRENVTFIIFKERYYSAIKIQTSVRRYRDKKLFIAMHEMGHYNGILSDIYLAPPRFIQLNKLRSNVTENSSYDINNSISINANNNGNSFQTYHKPSLAPTTNESLAVKFHIPLVIRNTRRIYWLATIVIQSRFRCWQSSRFYLYKKKCMILIQSLCRMYPKLKYYRRLKYYTIKTQAWARRTVKKKQYIRLKYHVVIIQKYVRRWEAILLKWRLLNKIHWQPNEILLGLVIFIQTRYREKIACKKVARKKFYKLLLEYSALVIQRSWYRYKRAFHTFFLMCCYRMREIEDNEFQKYCRKK
eukprot:gene11976-16030_t